MSDSLQTAVQKLRASTKSLNLITDEIAGVVQQVEEFLNETCSAGVYAQVTVQSIEDPESGVTSYTDLAYCRIGSRFRIGVVHGLDIAPEDEQATAWAECSRDIKLETAKKLPELILEIAKNIDRRVNEAQATSHAVSQVMSALTGQEGE